ncbi:MAG: recombination protein RecR [Candidatus Yanofskybacteria bacterium CG10_big_fil_rev_8_21_14_0_10_46_23]|uniref:Recombination protein RecR n=1 Tax=Candidatus Yanofskybacteria bacterium CG10_big_fil_rev_8_21_14_0_10_46_23 TaxID=1975098 RepID=A0A2H0R3Q2_9BACT|nr:MAG: recombination protein RecR [Candidatus Yanofskybacteria bacterium CG10_big_fil_rev_8_21_14_0_10_46_23]
MNGKAKQLIDALSKLPGIGPRQATRIVLTMLNWDKQELINLASAVDQLAQGVRLCQRCHNLSEDPLCHICQDPRRHQNVVCVVERITDLEAIEKTGAFKGTYHVLGGSINPLEQILPENLNIASLVGRVKNQPQSVELIIATNPNTQGEATALYLEDKLRAYQIKTTRLGRGLSSGSFLEYADEATLNNAFKNRK